MGTSEGPVTVIRTGPPPLSGGSSSQKDSEKAPNSGKKSRGDIGADEGKRRERGLKGQGRRPLGEGVSGLSPRRVEVLGLLKDTRRPLGSKDVLNPGASPMWPHRPALLEVRFGLPHPPQTGCVHKTTAPLSLYYPQSPQPWPSSCLTPAMPSSQVGRVSWAWSRTPAVRKPPASHPSTSWCRHPPAVTGSAELRTAVAGQGPRAEAGPRAVGPWHPLTGALAPSPVQEGLGWQFLKKRSSRRGPPKGQGVVAVAEDIQGTTVLFARVKLTRGILVCSSEIPIP